MSTSKLRTLLHALEEELHFARVDGFGLPTVGSLEWNHKVQTFPPEGRPRL